MTLKCLKCTSCLRTTMSKLCPIMDCPKSLVNGPCGGSYKGKCEISKDKACLWMEIFKLHGPEELEALEDLGCFKDYSSVAKIRKGA